MSIQRFALGAALALGLLTPTLAPAQDGDYRVVIQDVDSSNFPTVRIQFQVLPKNPKVDAWKPGQGAGIIEEVLGDKVDLTDPDVRLEVEPCEEHPVVMAVAVDTSGSVGGVLDHIKKGVEEVFKHLATAQTDDMAAMYTFDSNRKFRFPDDGSTNTGGQGGQTGQTATGTATYTQDGTAISQDPGFQQLAGGGFSPIWEGMDLELGKLLDFQHPRDDQAKKVIVAFTDGKNNRQPEKAFDLLQKAQLGGGVIISMGYGDADVGALTMLAESSGGSYMEGKDQNITNALFAILNSLRYSWCLEYESPHSDTVNEPADVTVVTGGSKGSARYPLPFLIPEDSRDVELFFPVGFWTFQSLMAAGGVPKVKVEMQLRDKDGNPWAPATSLSPDRPEEHKTLEFSVQTDAWIGMDTFDPLDPDMGADYGFIVGKGTAGDLWDDLFKIPTQYVDVHKKVEKGEQLIDGVDHFLIKAELDLTDLGFKDGAGRKYPSSTRLSVQDRTPPSVRMKLQPQDGGPLLEIDVHEETFHQDPAMVQGRPDSKIVRVRGTGAKTAAIRYHWRTPDGDAVEDVANGQNWSLWEDSDTDDDDEPDTPVFLTRENEFAMKDEKNTIFQRGIQVPTGTRIQLEVLSRDNYALLMESSADEDREALKETSPDSEKGPIYSQMDFTRREAQAGEEEAPFLPRVPRKELEEDLTKAGISWWIHSPYDDRDRFAYNDADPDRGIQWPGEINYAYSDTDLRQNLAAAGVDVPPDEPLRLLVLRAQDGQGNVTLVEFPLAVGDAGFQARTLEYESRRQRGLD